MKTGIEAIRRAIGMLFNLALVAVAAAATTIDPVERYGWGANIGWMDWRGDTNNGAVIGEYVCSGYLWAANVGWIHLGSGAPANGIQYQNNSATDYGVNHDGLGNLRGYAYGANIGWINFESTGAPRVDLVTGRLSGYAYSANCGWISLSNAVAQIRTVIAPGADSDGDGLPDAWERLTFGNLAAGPTGDPDNDGMNNLQEYLAGTKPLDGNDYLRITAFSTTPGGTLATVRWTSVPTRQYHLEKALNLGTGSWFDSGLGLIPPDGYDTERTLTDTNAPMRFYRVRAVRPLSP